MTRRVLTSALAVILLSAGIGLASPSPAPSPQAGSSAAPGGGIGVDPCQLLTARDASSVIGSVNPKPQRPSPNECLWSAASVTNTTGPVSQVLFTVDTTQQVKHGCKGFGCVQMVQSISNVAPGVIPGMDTFNNTVNKIGGTATMIEGLGQKAAWSNGILAVLQDQTVFKLHLTGTQSNMLDPSKELAQKVLDNMQANTAGH